MSMRRCLSIVSFLVLTLVCLSYTASVLRREYKHGEIVKRVFCNPTDYDIICCGSSHAYCSIIPMEIFGITGLRAGVIATRRQPLECTYYYLKEAFSRKNPKIVFLESFMVYNNDTQYEYEDEAILHDAIVAFPGFINKIRMIEALHIAGNREDLYFDLLKYHSRWQDLKLKDFHKGDGIGDNDFHQGYVFFKRQSKINDRTGTDFPYQPTGIREEKLKWLLKIRDLVKANGATLVVLTMPYEYGRDTKEMMGRIPTLDKFLQTEGIEHLDFFQLFSKVGLDSQADFYDCEHLNFFGARKVSRWLASWLEDHKGVFNRASDEDIQVWNLYWSEYERFCLSEGLVESGMLQDAYHWMSVYSRDVLRIKPKDRADNYVKLPLQLQPACVYRVGIKSSKLASGLADRILVRLRDSERTVASHYWMLPSDTEQSVVFSTPRSSDIFYLYVFAGDPRSRDGCKGVGIILENLTVEICADK